MTTGQKLTIVASVYNEAPVLDMFFEELTARLAKLDISYEIIFVDDGSTDSSQDVPRL